ncbi:hypothetical protein [Lentzea aerocolonigenes]|uniref:hypothetical protein n=1 Tax=Lentzea aerocolonigenes TaxID=68170 RepID=UPI0004C3AD6B|nr:hypothetical protein [Lentzea aerocolonigenes]MCP2242704.1 hypothetical protein [Lentzea aerocolonigenes]
MSRQLWELPSLPGPRGHLDVLSRDLDDGFSCVWVLPDELVERGTADDLVDIAGARPDSVRVEAPQRSRMVVPAAHRWQAPAAVTMPAWVRNTLGILDFDEPQDPAPIVADRPEETVVDKLGALFDIPLTGDPLACLALDEQLSGKVVVLCGWDGWDTADLGACVSRFTALLKEHGLAPTSRPRLLVAVREGDLPASVLERSDPVTTKVHWWWDVYGRLDTATVAAAVRRQSPWKTTKGKTAILRQLVATEVLIEVAGPDLLLAEHLAGSWNGQASTLAEQIEALPYDAVDDVVPAEIDGRAGGARPPQALRSAWRKGVVDRWDRRIRISPAAKLSSAEHGNLDSLIWRGQSRALTPLVDGCRARLEKVLRDNASASVIELLERGQDTHDWRRTRSRQGTLELGAMAWAVSSRRVQLSRPDADLLFCARDVRNSLAHLSPLTDEELDRLAAVMPETLW